MRDLSFTSHCLRPWGERLLNPQGYCMWLSSHTSPSVPAEIPKTQISTVVKGVPGGSVTIRCPHNNENDHKYLCLWGKDGQSCQPLVDNEEEVEEEYEGRLRLIQEPGNGIFTVIITKLTEKDNGFYWCAAEDVNPLYTPVKVQVVKGKSLSPGTRKEQASVLCSLYPHPSHHPPASPTPNGTPSGDSPQSQPHVQTCPSSSLPQLPWLALPAVWSTVYRTLWQLKYQFLFLCLPPPNSRKTRPHGGQ